MLPELSLNILDLAENAAKAGATLLSITVQADPEADRLEIALEDNGCGMTQEELKRAADPFYTSRDTRRVGLGLPFFQAAAESAGGQFSLSSEPGAGTRVCADFQLSHIDRMPLGDLCGTLQTLILCHPKMDLVFTYRYGKKSFALDTREARDLLGGVPLDAPGVPAFLKDYLVENKLETDGGAVY